MNPLAWAAAVAAVVAALGGVYLAGYRAAQGDCREKVASINAQAQADALETARRVDRLHVEIEALRSRPERIRTITRTIHVQADADCSSLPPEWVQLWNALPREPAEPAAVGDGGLPRVAGADRDGQGRD